MTAARNLSETFPFPVGDVTYTIATLPNRVLLAVTELGQAAQTEVLVRFGVKGIKGLALADGEAIECVRVPTDIAGLSGQAITVETFDAIPMAHLPMVSGEVFRVNSLSETEVGNSSAP